MPMHHYIYAKLTVIEYEHVRRAAEVQGVTMSDFVRDCVNSVFLEQGDEPPLATRPPRGARARMAKAAIHESA